jgi:multisubunit Na+/H+ antiporter MnhC subunit
VAAPNVGGWVRIGLLALPLYGLLTLWTTFIHQPDPNTDFEAYARYVSTTNYLVDHLFGSILGVTLAIFGAVALGVYLSSRRSALTAMVLSVAGNALILTIFGMSTFATPAVGRAYLEGQQNVVELNQDILGLPLILTALMGGLLYSTGTILFGIAVWRSVTLPKWAGVLYAPTGLLISILGLIQGQAQTLGSLLLIIGGGWIAWSAMRRPSTEPVETAAQPSRVS